MGPNKNKGIHDSEEVNGGNGNSSAPKTLTLIPASADRSLIPLPLPLCWGIFLFLHAFPLLKEANFHRRWCCVFYLLKAFRDYNMIFQNYDLFRPDRYVLMTKYRWPEKGWNLNRKLWLSIYSSSLKKYDSLSIHEGYSILCIRQDL